MMAPRSGDALTTIALAFGRGVGKSQFMRQTWYESIARYDGVLREGLLPNALRYYQRGVRVIHLQPTFKSCKDIHGEHVEHELLRSPVHDQENWHFLQPRADRTRWHFTFPGSSWVQWFGMREANAARGLRGDIVTIDECDDVEPGDIEAVVLPMLSEPWSLKLLLLGGTPRRGRFGTLYKYYKDGLDPEKPNAHSVFATYRDSPETVSATLVESARAIMLPEVFRREWECDFDAAEGLVYSMFDAGFHVREPRRDALWSEFLVGVDWGWEDPGVFLLLGVLGKARDAQIWVLDEIVEQHRTISWWADRALMWNSRFPDARWYADPSQPANIETLRRDGRARIVSSVKHTIEDGVSAVADRMLIRRYDQEDESTRYAKLFVHPKCVRTIDELGKYRRRRDPRDKDRYLDDIEDKHNHCMDSLRYPIVSRFGVLNRSGVQDSGAGWT